VLSNFIETNISNMRIPAIIIGIIISLNSTAQVTPQGIRKYKISCYVQIQSASDGGDSSVYRKYFDRQGNDTSFYSGDMLVERKKYFLNRIGRIEKRVSFDGEGKEKETAVYSYKADGSYQVTNTDKQFGMTDYEWYDKKGNLAKTKSPDGNTTNYTYNTKNQLLSTKSDGYNGGTVIDITYQYNTKGQRIKAESKGEYRWTKTYTYNKAGLPEKVITVSSDEGVTTIVTDRYKYEFLK